DDFLDGCRVAFDRPRQRITAERPEAHLAVDDLLAWLEPHALVVGHQDQSVAGHRRPSRREIERHNADALAQDVLPHVELGPVRQRKDAHRLALVFARIVERPQLGALALRVPSMIAVAEAEHPLLGPALLLVASRAAERRVEAMLVEG